MRPTNFKFKLSKQNKNKIKPFTHNHLRHLVVNFLVSKLFTRVGPRAAFVIRNDEMVQLEPDYPKNYSPHKVKVLETLYP